MSPNATSASRSLLDCPPFPSSCTFCHLVTYCRFRLSRDDQLAAVAAESKVSASPPRPRSDSRAEKRPLVLPSATVGGCARVAAEPRHATARTPGKHNRGGRGAGFGQSALRRRASRTTRHPLPPQNRCGPQHDNRPWPWSRRVAASQVELS